VLFASNPWLAAHDDPSHVFLDGDSEGGNLYHHLATHPDVHHSAVAGNNLIKGIVLIQPWFWDKAAAASPTSTRSTHLLGLSTRSHPVEARWGGYSSTMSIDIKSKVNDEIKRVWFGVCFLDMHD
jgi:acetyl esterase/lipase